MKVLNLLLIQCQKCQVVNIVPIIPSIKITDLATAMAPKLKQKIIGIRAGEKLHEVMCPKDEAHLVRKFNNYYIIFPSIQFINSSNIKNNLIITGKKVEGDFEYNSKNNKHFLKVNEIKKLLKKLIDLTKLMSKKVNCLHNPSARRK